MPIVELQYLNLKARLNVVKRAMYSVAGAALLAITILTTELETIIQIGLMEVEEG